MASVLCATGETNRSGMVRGGVPIPHILSPQPYFISSTSCFFPCHLLAQLPPFLSFKRSRHGDPALQLKQLFLVPLSDSKACQVESDPILSSGSYGGISASSSHRNSGTTKGRTFIMSLARCARWNSRYGGRGGLTMDFIWISMWISIVMGVPQNR